MLAGLVRAALGGTNPDRNDLPVEWYISDARLKRGEYWVAEGVERNDQVKELLGMGVEIMQGYLFNAPVRPDGVDPLRWFKPRTEEAPTNSGGLTPLEVSRTLVAPGEHARPPRRG